MGKKGNRCKKCSGRTGGSLRPRLKLHTQTANTNLWKCPHCGHEVPRRVRRRYWHPEYIKVQGRWIHKDTPIKLKDAFRLLGISVPGLNSL